MSLESKSETDFNTSKLLSTKTCAKFSIRTQLKAVGAHKIALGGIDYMGVNKLSKSSPSLAVNFHFLIIVF